MRLIDAAEAMKYITDEYNRKRTGDGLRLAWIEKAINDAPTVDAVEVVRCKDCRHYNAGFECLIEGYGIERPKEWFCADGERRSE